MKHYELIHNSPEWFEARAGVATSSSFDRIITNKTLEKIPAAKYMGVRDVS